MKGPRVVVVVCVCLKQLTLERREGAFARGQFLYFEAVCSCGRGATLSIEKVPASEPTGVKS